MIKVNEIFYSIQGEGHHTGTPAVFVRLSGCNLHCDFCDTKHESGLMMDEDEIVRAVMQYPASTVVITGGEPTLQLTASLVSLLHGASRRVHIETNGSVPLDPTLADCLDWITVSPKQGAQVRIQRADELKVLFDMDHPHLVAEAETACRNMTRNLYLQPCDRGNDEFNRMNTAACVAYILSNPQWRLSLQTHKILNIQ